MSLSISQGIAVSYPKVIADKNKAANQWEESALLREMKRQGMIKSQSLGPTIELPLDYQRNPAGLFQTTDLMPLSLNKTEVLTSASYAVAEVTAPIVWSKKDEVQNPTDQQKIALVSSLIDNALSTHDDLIEQAMFVANTNGFLGLPTHITTAGTGSDGGIDSSANTWWRCQQNTYVDDTDIEAGFTTTWNQCAKGSGSKMMPTLMVSDATQQALFEGTQQANQRYVDTEELKAGFKVLGFKTCRYVFSQYGLTNIVQFMNPKNAFLVVSKEMYRDLGDTQEIPNANGYVRKIYTALQFVTNNRSRLGSTHL